MEITKVLIFYSRPHGSAFSLGTLQLLGNSLAANSRPDDGPFCKNRSHMWEYREYFLRPSVLDNKGTTQRSGKPHAR